MSSSHPRTVRACPAALLPQLATCPCLSPAGLVNERVEDIQEERHDCGRGGQDKVSDAAFVWVLGGARTPLLAMRPPGVSCRPLGCLELQLLFFSLQFLPDQRSLRCGNLRQHLENTTGNTPRHPPGQAAACKPSPVPSQPASPCSTIAVAPAPAALQGLQCMGRSRAPAGGSAGGSVGSCQAASSWGCRERSGQADPGGADALALVGPGGKGAGSSQSQPSFWDPNRIFQTTANPEPAGAAGAGGTVNSTASHSSALVGGDALTASRSPASRRIIHRQPITAWPFTVPVIMQSGQSGRRSPEGTQCLGGCGCSEALGDPLSPGGIQRAPSLWGIRRCRGPDEPRHHERTG